MKVDNLDSASPTFSGDSVLWCNVGECLIYVDTDGKQVFAYYPGEQTTISMSFQESVGFAVPTSLSREDKLVLFVGLEQKILEVNLSENRILRTVATVPMEFYQKGMRFSCAKSSPDGVLYAGYMHRDWVSGFKGYLFKVDCHRCLIDIAYPHYLKVYAIYYSVQQIVQVESEDGDTKFVMRNIMSADPDGVHYPNGLVWHGSNTLYMVANFLNVAILHLLPSLNLLSLWLVS